MSYRAVLGAMLGAVVVAAAAVVGVVAVSQTIAPRHRAWKVARAQKVAASKAAVA